nr:4Fe-4S binding protein [Candidatus Sigynarchaeum springense]
MKIKQDKCTGCGSCAVICPVEAIHVADGKAMIDKDACVECSTCYRTAVCPARAIIQERLKWPRLVRNIFSDVASSHKITGVPGRGTEEMKTNDVTGRFGPEDLGFSIELGRPGLGARLASVELFTVPLSRLGVEYEQANPLTALLADGDGHIKDDVKGERVLSAIIEFKVPSAKLTDVLAIIKELEGKVDTVFTVGMIARAGADGGLPIIDVLSERGFPPRPNAKVNVGLGRASPGGGVA